MTLAKIENDEIVIRIPIESLSGHAFKGLDQVGYEDGDGMDFDLLALDLVAELNRESEDGSTPVDLMLDECVVESSEQGAESFAYMNT